MHSNKNKQGQPIGKPLPDWTPPKFPDNQPIEGNFCNLIALNPETHGPDLYKAYSQDTSGKNWTYLPYGPFESFDYYQEWLISICTNEDPLFYAITSKDTESPIGVASYLRIFPSNGSIEVGHIHFSEKLKRSPVATEAMFLLMRKAFELGYRRYEWKCDMLNTASCAAAQRLGFSFEGVFKQATVYKGRNRDTAWFSIVDTEWPAIKETFTQWLDAKNFDQNGNQIVSLRDLTQPLLRSPVFKHSNPM